MQSLHIIRGIVKKGAQRGREYGFPTANVSLTVHIPAGVYVSQVLVKSQTYHAATFIGSAITYGDAEYKSESTLIDFDQDIYGEEVTITLLKKLRDNRNFDKEEDLINQMHKDMEMTKAFFR